MEIGTETTPGQATDQMQQAAQDAQQQSQQSAPLTQQAQGASDGSSTDGDQKNSPAAPQQAPQSQQQGPQTQQDQKTGDQGNQPGLPKNPQGPQQPAVQNNPQTHPAVQKANLVHDIALALAGGPHFTTSIDPNTGTTTRTQIPVSGKQIAMAIAMEALGGGIAGMGVKGPNNESQALQAGFAQGSQQQKQAQAAEAQQAQQASSDYARQAAITATNFTTHQNAMRLGQMEYDQHKQYVSDAKPVLDNLQQVGAVKASNVRETDLLDKYHVTKDMAVVDGIVPRMNTDGSQATNKDGSKAWDNTYSIIDPDAKIGLPDATAKFLADHHVQGYFRMVDGKATAINLPDSQQLKARMVVDGLATASAIRISESALNQQLGKLADGADEQKKFQVSLTDGLESGSVTPKALKTYAQFSNVPIDQLRAQMEKAKVDADTIGQIMSVIPKDAIEESAKQHTSDVAAQKAADTRTNLVVSKNNFDEVLGAPKGTYSAAQVSAAQAIDKQVRHEKSQDAYNSGANHEQGVIDTKKKNGIPLTSGGGDAFGVSDPSLAPLVKAENIGPDGINHKFLDAMAQKNPQRAALVQAIIRGQRLESFYGLAKKDGQALAEDVHAADSSFDQSLAQRYNKMAIGFAPGSKNGDKLVAANTALKHLANLYDNTSWTTGLTPDAIGNKSPIHIPGYAARKADMEAVSSELAKYYKGGAPDKDAVAALHTVMTATNPETAKDGARELAKLLHGGIDSVYASWKDSMPSNFVPKQAFFDPDGAKAYQHVTGEAVDPKYLKSNKTPGGGDTGQPQLLTGQRQGEAPVVHNGQVVGYTMQGKNGMRPVAPFAAH